MNKSQYNNLVKLCETLESGEYIQGKRSLRVLNRFCCLGVALNLIDNTEWHRGIHKLSAFGLKGFGFMGNEALNYYGLTDLDQKYLAYLNDQEKSFTEISRYIRENILTRYNNDTTAN